MDNFEQAFENLGIETEDIEDTHKKQVESSKENDLYIAYENEKKEPHKIFYGLTAEDRKLAVDLSIVPKSYKDANFDPNKIKENIARDFMKYKGLYKVYNMNTYVETCMGILSALRCGELPNCSYIIGAPNGFGKTSFVNECLMTMIKNNFRVAPYISLWELAQIRVDNEHRIMNPYIHPKTKEQQLEEAKRKENYIYSNANEYTNIMKRPEVVIGRYSYSEYINADCLFVSLTDVISKDIESHTLYQLLAIRGAKALPTIVMMSTSLQPYENDPVLAEYVWNEIKTDTIKDCCYDRVYHVSSYKMKSMDIGNSTNNGIIS